MREQTPWQQKQPNQIMDQDQEAVYFLHKETWVEWDTRVREDLVQRAAKRCVARLLRLRRGRMGAEAS
jgi:hypothetical protein